MRKIILLMLACVPFAVFAQGFQVNLEGQKQIGMGHTGTGLLLDGSSVFFNPGAVAKLSENYLQAGVSPLMFKSGFVATGSNVQYNTADKIAPPFNVYAVWGPKAAKWKVGLGVYTPYGGLTDWGTNWPGKYTLVSLDLKTIFFQPTVSYKISDVISVGAGFVYNHGSVNLKRAIPLADANNPQGEAELKGGGNGYGFNAGVFIDTKKGLTIGITHRSKVNTKLNDGDAVFTVPGSLQTSFPSPNTFKAELPLAATTSIGFGYSFAQKWLVAFDANYVHFDTYKALAFDYGNNTTTLQDTYSPRNYKNAVSLRVGAQYKATDKLMLRAGGGYASTPVRDGYVTPEVPDANRSFYTAGLSYLVNKHFDLDLSFEYERLGTRTQTNIETQLSGTFKSNVYIPGVALVYHW
ncbi:outer membrane protein transport protein [Mucilaginibacter sp. PAMB04274]|uniref:OmpP1/FadL family transporter n=1 Tax=Mucilaginibacter sp. PAMB04274 TaxID=3138568 RepID=UPI0031F6BC61